MKKLVLSAIAASMVLAGGVILFVSNTASKNDNMLLTNVEVIAQAEAIQRDVGECMYAPRSECWIIHPTDPDKDITRRDSKW